MASAAETLCARMDRHAARGLVEVLNRDAERIARRFGLRYRSVEAERANVRSRFGVCYADGTIRIRLRHAVTGRPLKYSSLVNTICHELAHLRHFNHGERFKRFYLRLLEFARREGIYRPRPASPPQQGREAAAQRGEAERRQAPARRAASSPRESRSEPAPARDAPTATRTVQLGLFADPARSADRDRG